MADIKQRILFQFGTLGTSGASKSIGAMALKFGAASLATALTVKTFNDLYDSAIELNRQMKALNTDMSEFNARTGGMIDTNDGFRAAIKLQNAELTATKEQMAAIGVAAGYMNQQLGGGADGTTTQFNLLVNSIIKARETGLLPFGIELSQTTDKAAASQEAMDKLVEKFDGVSVAATNAKEQYYSLKNSLDTIIAAEFNGWLDDVSDDFEGLLLSLSGNHEAMLQYETDLIATEGALAQNFSALTDLDSVSIAYNQTVIDAIAAGESNWIIQGRLIEQNKHVSDSTLDNARAYIKERDSIMLSVKAQREYEAFQAEMAEKAKARKEQGDKIDKLNAATDRMRNSSSQSELKSAYTTALNLVKAGDTGPFNEFDVAGVFRHNFNRIAENERIAREVGGTGGSGIGGGGAVKQKTDFVTSERRQSIDGAMLGSGDLSDVKGLTESELYSDNYAGFAKGQVVADRERSMGAAAGAAASAAQAEAKAKDDQRKEDEDAEAKHQAKILEIRQATANATVELLGTTSELANKNSEKGFKLYQTTAFGENAISTMQGASGAFNRAVETLPPGIGQAVGIASAAAVTARGIAVGRDILQQRRTSKSSPSTSSAGAFPSGGAQSAGEQSANTFNFSFVLDGNTVQKQMVDQNEMAAMAGNPSFAMSQG